MEQDYQKALKWFSRAAKQGHAGTQVWIGSMYEHGRGVKGSRDDAIYWYELAALQGEEEGKARLDALRRRK